jgi:response regulator NasT
MRPREAWHLACSGLSPKLPPCPVRVAALKVLLADFHPQRASALEASLAGQGASVQRLRPGELLAEAVLAGAPDLVIVDMELPDRDGLVGIREMSARLPVVLFVDQDDDGFMEEAIAAGVSSYNLRGSSLPEMKPILRIALAMFQRFRSLEDELHKAAASLEERKAVDRAKASLMRQRNMSEPEAYGFLRRRAMDEGRRIPEIALEILASRKAG